jgi:hypothetical protein
MPQVIYIPRTSEPLRDALAGMIDGIRARQERELQNRRMALAQDAEARRAAAEKQAFEEARRRLDQERVDRQRGAEAEIARLAPQVSMFEPAAPTPMMEPAQPELGVPERPAGAVPLGGERLTSPLLTELTLPTGEKVPLTIQPSLEASQAETQAETRRKALAGAIVFPKDAAVPEDFRGRVFLPGLPGYDQARQVSDKFAAALFRESKAPTTRNIGGRELGWNPATQRFDVDFGPSGTPKPAAGGAGDARLDRSFQYNNTQLERLSKPYTDQAARMTRLVATVDQRTPQADALVAPELLTVMAGGQGSGLRMNEAEIKRIVGGRSNYEGLKAALNRWSLDPSEALSITDPQRAQIKALILEVAKRNGQAQELLDAASQGLIDAADVKEHRKILAKLRRDLRLLGGDEGAAGTGGPGAGNPSSDPLGIR